MPRTAPDPATSPFRDALAPPLGAGKFVDPARTARGEPRATVAFERLDTLWLNTGTLCNLACATCYIESSPKNDRLAYLTLADALPLIDEAVAMGVREIGFTGGEPFMNPAIVALLAASLARGPSVLVLTNAMRPMRRFEAALLDLRARHGDRLALRVSLDHHRADVHEAERGPDTWDKALSGLRWLAAGGFAIAVAGRLLPGEAEAVARAGYAALFARERLPIDATDSHALVLFPEMNARAETPEISEACWGILGRDPAAMMCASSRMVVKRRGAARPVVVACTLTPYEAEFELGDTLARAARTVALNHPHCARFCVLGGSSCGG